MTLPSASSLIKLVSYLSVFSWPGQSTALKSLTLRWLQKAQNLHYTTPRSRHEASKRIILNLRIVLEAYTEGLKSLSLDFPGAGIAFQTAILSTPGFVSKQHLKHLHITNGLCPLFQPATYLLCAISSLCARSLEQLIIDMGCETFYLNDEECFPTIIKVPGKEMFRTYETFRRLKKLQVKDIGGFTDECLEWVVCESRLLNFPKKGYSLILEGCPSLTGEGVEKILAGMKETYTRIKYLNVEPVNESKVPTPDTWWALFGYDENSTVGNDDDSTFSFMPGDDSSVEAAGVGSVASDTTQEDIDTFENHFDRTKCGSDKGSQGSYPSTYARQRAYTQHFVQKYTRDAHICDSTAGSCRNLPRLDVPTYGIPCSPSYGYCSSGLGDGYSMAPEWMFGEDADYINDRLTSSMGRRGSVPVIDGEPRKFSRESRTSSSSGFPMRSLSDPLPNYMYKKKSYRKPMNLLHSGDFKRLTMLVEEAPMAKGLRFMSLRGLWGGLGGNKDKKCWFKRSMERLGYEC